MHSVWTLERPSSIGNENRRFTKRSGVGQSQGRCRCFWCFSICYTNLIDTVHAHRTLYCSILQPPGLFASRTPRKHKRKEFPKVASPKPAATRSLSADFVAPTAMCEAKSRTKSSRSACCAASQAVLGLPVAEQGASVSTTVFLNWGMFGPLKPVRIRKRTVRNLGLF